MLSNVSSNFKLSLLGKELSPVPFAKDLGVFMDSTPSFDEHVMQIKSKCIVTYNLLLKVHQSPYSSVADRISDLYACKACMDREGSLKSSRKLSVRCK